MANADPQTGYAPVNGLDMYYEIHGTGEPLVLLHGAYMTIDAMGELVPGLAGTRQVTAAEMQGHGRTADIDRPITYEQMADDTGLGITPDEMDGGHLVALSRPKELADRLEAYLTEH